MGERVNTNDNQLGNTIPMGSIRCMSHNIGLYCTVKLMMATIEYRVENPALVNFIENPSMDTKTNVKYTGTVCWVSYRVIANVLGVKVRTN